MVDPDTLLTTLYVMIDEFCPSQLPPEVHPGPRASLSRREVITLGLFGPWACFRGERAFSRYAHQHRRPACPTLPHRSPFHRRRRHHHQAVVACFRPLVDLGDGRHGLDEALDRSAVPTRDATRRGAGWLPDLAEIGWSHRLGWYEGLHRLMAVHPRGVITGVGLGSASAKDQPWAETCLAWRCQPHPQYRSVGKPALGPSVSDQGFEGQAAHARWWSGYGAQVMCPPKRTSPRPWSKRLRRWLAGGRQLIEPVDENIHQPFGLHRERPHDLTGFQARWAAKMARPNFCLWFNAQVDRPSIAFAGTVLNLSCRALRSSGF